MKPQRDLLRHLVMMFIAIVSICLRIPFWPGPTSRRSPKAQRMRHGLMQSIPVKLAAAFLLYPYLAAPLLAGPLDIQLAGVQFGWNDMLFDVEGNQIGERLNTGGTSRNFGPSRKTCRLIFDVEPIDAQPLFDPWPGVQSLERGSLLVAFQELQIEQVDGRRQVVLDIHYDTGRYERHHNQQDIRLEDAFDVTLKCYAGPAAEADCTFTAPFAAGAVKKANGYQLEVKPSSQPPGGRTTFTIAADGRIDIDSPAIAFDVQGNRHFAQWGGGRSGPQGSRYTLRVDGLSAEKIARLNIGERPLEFHFRNIRIDPPGSHDQELALLADAVALMDVPSNSINGLYNVDFKNQPDLSLTLIHLLRGWPLLQAWEGIQSADPPIGPKALAPADAERLRATAADWTQSTSPPFRQLGGELARWGGWEEAAASSTSEEQSENQKP